VSVVLPGGRFTLPGGYSKWMTIAGKPIPEGGYIVALQNGKKIALAQRRHRVIQAKIAGRSEAEIAEQEGVAQYTIWKDIRAYLGEVRRGRQGSGPGRVRPPAGKV
jgi:hypothetical protein